MTQDYIPFSQIVADIEKLCTEGATGTLFVVTKSNRSAQLMLDKGEIVFVYFFNKRGEEALELMSKIQNGRYRFQEGGVSRRMDLPTTDVIIQILAGGQTIDVQPVKKKDSGSGISKEQKNVLESCLAGYIGPMARIICEDHLGGIIDIHGAITALAAEIPSVTHAKEFKVKALAMTRGIK